ncbi:MAG: A24 family peptidase [Lachnospira sp.]|nr:A24 family peptidase [Lachnospira sp.]
MTVFAVFDDFKRYRISNRIIFAGLIAGVVLQAWDMADKRYEAEYILGLVGGFLLSYFMYKVKAIGAGDVKLYAVTGLILGIKIIPVLMVSSMIAGVVMGGVYILLKKSRQVVLEPFQGIGAGVLHGFHYSLAVLIGEIISIVCICYGGIVL